LKIRAAGRDDECRFPPQPRQRPSVGELVSGRLPGRRHVAQLLLST